MAQENLKVRSANRVEIIMDGILVGLAQSCRMSDNYGPEGASGIGDIHVIEYVPTLAQHDLNIGQLVLRQQTLRAKGITIENGDNALKGMIFDVVVRDKDSGQELRKYMGVSYASGDVEVTKHQILVTNGMYKALDVTGTLV